MKLSSLLNPDLIITRKPVTPALKETLIQNLVQEMVKLYPFELNKDQIIKALREREALGETILPGGIALPHARLENYKDLLIGIAIPKTPISRPSGEPIRMIILILAPKASSNLYLNTLAAISKLAQNQVLFDKLLDAENPDQFINLVLEAAIPIKKEITISDVMNTQIVQISPEDNIKTLCDHFCRLNTTYAAVIDNGRFVGEVALKDVISKGIPQYAQMMENLSFLSSFEPFEELLDKENQILVKEIMKKPGFVLKTTEPVIHAAFELIQQGRNTLAVVDETGQVKGTMSHMDLLNNVLRK